MYKASTFLTSLFCKFQIKDKEVRKEITRLYTPLIDIALNDVAPDHRPILFKELLPSLKSALECFAKLKKLKADDSLVQSFRNSLQSHIAFHFFLVKNTALRLGRTTVFDDIMKSVNLTETGCEIGECIILFKQSNNDEERQDIRTRLEVLLSDYNIVAKTTLTVDSVLSKSLHVNDELY